VLRGSKDMRADWTIRVSDCDGNVEDGLKALTDVNVLGLAAMNTDIGSRSRAVLRASSLAAARAASAATAASRAGPTASSLGCTSALAAANRAESSIANAVAFFLTSSAFSLSSIADVSARSEASNCASATRSCGDPAKPSRWYGGGRRGSWRRALRG
jgi:hypothetical protein